MIIPIKVREPHEMIEDHSHQIHETGNESDFWEIQMESEMQSQN